MAFFSSSVSLNTSSVISEFTCGGSLPYRQRPVEPKRPSPCRRQPRRAPLHAARVALRCVATRPACAGRWMRACVGGGASVLWAEGGRARLALARASLRSDRDRNDQIDAACARVRACARARRHVVGGTRERDSGELEDAAGATRHGVGVHTPAHWCGSTHRRASTRARAPTPTLRAVPLAPCGSA